MDILFIVDDSGSMAEEQSNLATNFPLFIDVLNNYMASNGEPLDYRVAITTTGRDITYTITPPIPGFPPITQTEQGDDGAFRNGCGLDRRWLERGDGDVGTMFSCRAQVGTGGPSIEMPLYATELALADRMADGTNTGFLREDALLAVVMLTDENDCSRTDNNFNIGTTDTCDPSQPLLPVTDHLAFLDSLKGERGRWAAAAIAGPGPGDCMSSFGAAAEAGRLLDFIAQTGQNGVFSSICNGDLAMALMEALDTFDAACQSFPGVD